VDKKKVRAAGLLLAATFAATGSLPSRAAPPPVEAFGKLPLVDHAVLSPNGNLVAWQDNRGPRPQVVVFDLGAAKVKRTVTVDDEIKLRGLQFADDETLLLSGSRTQRLRASRTYTSEYARIVAIDVDTGASRMLLMGGGDRGFVTGATVLAKRTSKPRTVTMSTLDYLPTKQNREIGTRLAGTRSDSGWIHTVFHVDTRSGRSVPIEYGTQFTEDWVVDEGGVPVARSEWDPGRDVYRVVVKKAEGWAEIYRREDGSRLPLIGRGPDGRSALAIGSDGDKRRKLWAIPFDGSAPAVLLEDGLHDVWAAVEDPLTGAVAGVLLGGLTPEVRWLDTKLAARHKALSQAFPGRSVWIVGRSETAKRVLVLVEGTSAPHVYYLVDFRTGKADVIGETYPALANAKLGEVRALSLPARDGTSVPSYVTLPAEPNSCPPLVVMPHGGPEARDDFTFDWFAQFLATRGYVVLQPQFRGSTGFGEAHRRAGYRQWGGLMQDDVTDAVKAVLSQGLADPKRVCIVGASYGGYAALAGAAFTPELYVCAVSINGVSDLPTMLAFEERQAGAESDALAYWHDHIGLASDARVIDRSPARAAESVRAPVLLLHGVDDTLVPVTQSEKMARRLAESGRRHALVKLPGEDHWLSRGETRVRVLTEVEQFLWANAGSLPASSCARPPASAGTL
jgi:dipeptidyl aminopeptidase/acylaminoacyl peptidase